MHAHPHSHSNHDISGLSESAKRWVRIASLASITVASCLLLLKVGAWLMTDSLSILSSLIDSLLDVCASLVNFVAVRYAMKPPDDDHRFGHGKAEDLAAMAQATFIAGSGILVCFEAIKRLVFPEPLVNETLGIGVMAVSIVATGALVLFQRWVSRRTGSTAIRADSLHYISDLFTNLSVIVAIALSAWAGITGADPLFAILIALAVLYTAWRIARESFDNLMDKEFDEADRARIEAVVNRYPQAIDMHDLKTRRAGMNKFIQFHLMLPATMTLKEAHDISEAIEHELMHLFPNTEVMIHHDPEGYRD